MILRNLYSSSNFDKIDLCMVVKLILTGAWCVNHGVFIDCTHAYARRGDGGQMSHMILGGGDLMKSFIEPQLSLISCN